MGYYSSYKQWIKPLKLWETNPEVVKNFLMEKEQEGVSLRPRNKTWALVLVLGLARFYAYIFVKSKAIKTQVTKFITLIYHYTQVCSCIVLMFYATLGGPSWFLSLGKQKAFEDSSFCCLFLNLNYQPGFSWQVSWVHFAVGPQGSISVCLAKKSNSWPPASWE